MTGQSISNSLTNLTMHAMNTVTCISNKALGETAISFDNMHFR